MKACDKIVISKYIKVQEEPMKIQK